MAKAAIISADTKGYGESLSQAATALRDGALVLLPTETVYGIAAAATNASAMRRLREIKDRTDRQPFTVHLAQRKDAAQYVDHDCPLARRLARKTWPGPLTIVCRVKNPQNAPIAATVGQHLDEIYHDARVGLRCPDHPAAQRVLAEAGTPVVATSANLKGGRPPTDFDSAFDAVGDRVDFAIDAGHTRVQSASTIVEIDGGHWRIVRAGVLDERTLSRLATSEILMVCTGNSCRSPLAEYLLRRELARQFGWSEQELAAAGYRVSSAGTAAIRGGPISAGSLDELRKRGIDASAHATQPVTMALIRRCSRIYAMSVDHRNRLIELAPALADRIALLDPSGSIADPIGGGPAEYAACAAQIEKAVRIRAKELADEDRDWQ